MRSIVLTIGNTGSGKSTLLQALVRGAQAMEERTLKNTITLRNGKQRTQYVNVIDVKEMFRGEALKIGHSRNQSETFVPTFIHCSASGITFTDVAGQNDTRGEMMEIINLLLIKRVFNMAQKVRMLVVIPYEEVGNARGGVVRQQMETVLKIIQGNYEDMHLSLIHISEPTTLLRNSKDV